MRARLIPHPTTADGPLRSLDVNVRPDGDRLRLSLTGGGEPARIAWPQPATPLRTDGLWRRTCFEAFVATDDGYREFNVSPSGQWAAYAFDAPRKGMRDAVEAATAGALNRFEDGFRFDLVIDRPLGARRLGVSAVIQQVGGGLSYWALAHPSAKPDFHHPDSFVLELP